ncbi:MAG: hypothetical protein RLZ98_3133 [Pseudomonadota bacterium]
MDTIFDSLRRLTNSPAFKFVLIGILILLLTIPLLFAYLMVAERQSYANQAQGSVGQMWGRSQTIRGPFIVTPTTRTEDIRTKDGVEKRAIREYAVFLPEDLKVKSEVKSEIRQRGIFEVPVYRSTIRFEGRFIKPITTVFEQSDITVKWGEAVLVLTLDDVRGIKRTAALTMGGGATRQFRAGTGSDGFGQTPGIHVPVSESEAKDGFPFSFELALNGSSKLQFVPAGGETEVKIASDWPHPSFSGAFLPDEREISDAGFTATWRIPRLARGEGQTMRFSRIGNMMGTKNFGVDFYQPVKFYSLAERALKYAVGFIAVIFLSVFVMEIQNRKRVHWIQYMFVGLSLIVFYLVLIGTAEHIGFDLGYLCAAVATSALIGTYVGAVMRSMQRGATIFGVVAVIYALLYLLLRVEDYAMLIGSLAAFALLAVAMFATKDVDWSRPSESRQT